MGAAESREAAKVKSIFIYPIKSCRGISVPEAPITPTGFRWDRQWLVVNDKGRGCTQRVEPKLALVEVELPIEAFTHAWTPNCDSFLVVRAPGMNVLKIALSANCAPREDVSLWEWCGSALDEGDDAANWFSDYLGKPCRLIRFNEDIGTRFIDSDRARGYNIKFNDVYQFLLASQGSLDALNNHLKEPVPIDRFRPNIFVDGCAPFAEDMWKDIRINEAEFYATELCYRCKVTTINQQTAKGGSEPLEALKKFRSDKILLPDKKSQGRVYFGQLFVCPDAFSKGELRTIRVGDSINVLNVYSSYVDATT